MKNLLFSLCCLLAFTTGCKKDDNPPCSMDLGDGDCILDFEETLVETFLYEDGTSYIYTYDAESRVVKIANAEALFTFDYSLPGKVIRDIVNPLSGKTTGQNVYSLENGLTAMVTRKDSNGTVVAVNVFDRNLDGTVKKISYFDSNNQLLSYDEYEYDTDGNETAAKYRDKNGYLIYLTSSTYDSNAPQNTLITGKVFIWPDQPKRPTRTIFSDYTFNPNSPQTTTTNFTYELDKFGRIIKETQNDGTSSSVTQYVYKI